MTAEEWAAYKRALAEYSTLRPQRVYQTDWEPTLNTKTQTFPRATVIGVETLGFGARDSVYNVLASETAVQGWAEDNGVFAITPVFTEAAELIVVWKEVHSPDELTQTAPTLPVVDAEIVKKLQEAYLLEAEARSVLEGPIKYTVGQKSFSRETVAESLLKRARELRFEVSLETGGSAAEWA